MLRFIFHIIGILATFAVVSYGVFFALLNRPSVDLALPFIGDFNLPLWLIVLGFLLLGLFLGFIMMLVPLALSGFSRRRLNRKVKNLEKAEKPAPESTSLELAADKTGHSQ